MSESQIRELAIHPIHRKLAEITFLCLDKNGRLIIDQTTLRLIQPLLQDNLELIRTLDELTELSIVAYQLGDTNWVHDICNAIEFVKDNVPEKRKVE
ncbi:hypothetical protein ACM1RC_26760 [Paenibacillus azoreducens]|uniref:DUF7667 family protein n=1 Tax=Paenibacillus azoreducens TaxID=116718 RepID=UPI0039F63D2B